ncbi:hypothetical protein K501DRAFT_268995 [Backusella circina FSU 941]|nr:hypothetical protein K501DRAFT_268995 [Backusella circina FSU 941]
MRNTEKQSLQHRCSHGAVFLALILFTLLSAQKKFVKTVVNLKILDRSYLTARQYKEICRFLLQQSVIPYCNEVEIEYGPSNGRQEPTLFRMNNEVASSFVHTHLLSCFVLLSSNKAIFPIAYTWELASCPWLRQILSCKCSEQESFSVNVTSIVLAEEPCFDRGQRVKR